MFAPGLGQLILRQFSRRPDNVGNSVGPHGHDPEVAAGLQHEALPIPPVGVPLGAELVVEGANDPVVLGVNDVHGIHVGADKGRSLAPVLETNPDRHVEVPARAGEAQADRTLEVYRAKAVIEDEEARVGLTLHFTGFLMLQEALNLGLIPGLADIVLADDATPLAVELRRADDEDPAELARAGQAVKQVFLEMALAGVSPRDERGQVRGLYLEPAHFMRGYHRRAEQ